jgi:hypothetical protein
LLEGQRTNLVTYSEQFNNAAWGKDASITVSANYSISPDGYQNADRIQKAVTGGAEGFSQNFFGLTAGSYTISFYAKSNTSSNQNSNILFGAFQAQSITITPSWQRFTKTFTASTIVDYNGMIASNALDVSIFGWQLEAGAYATSYIPTLSASVTRVADAASKTGISSLIGQTEGVLFVELKTIANNQFKRISLNNGAFTNSIFLDWDNSNNIYLKVFNGGTVTLTILGAFNYAITNKIAIAYKNNDYAFYINGTLQGTSTSVGVPSGLSAFQFSLVGNELMEGTINQALLFKTRLTNAQLAELTAL